MGIVYYANYFVWFEVGRTDLLRDAGWSYRDMELEGFALPVFDAHCRFRHPARYDDELTVRTTGSVISPVRLRFDYQVVRGSDRQVLAEGATLHASVGEGQRPRRLPDRVRRLFALAAALPQ